jgi:hypothetical protein
MSDSEVAHHFTAEQEEPSGTEQPPIVNPTPTPTPAAPKPIRGAAAAAAAERKLKADAERMEELKALIKEAFAGIQLPLPEKSKKRSVSKIETPQEAPIAKKLKKVEKPTPVSAPQKKVVGVPAKVSRQAGHTSKKQPISGPKKILGAGQAGAKKGPVTAGVKKGSAIAKTASAPTVKSKPLATAYPQQRAAPTRLNGMYSQIFAR